MGIIYLMLIVSLVIALFFLGAFLWSTKTGQYEDDFGPSVRILFENEVKEVKTEQTNNENGSREV